MEKHQLNDFTFNVPVQFFQQGDVYVAYTPALDLSTYGSNKKEAQVSFTESIQTFFSSFDDVRELGQVLESLGWQKRKTTWQPPKIDVQKVTLPASYMAECS